MATDAITIQTKLYANNGIGASTPSTVHTSTLDMAGVHLADGTQAIAFGVNNAELLDVPGDVTGDRWLLIRNLEAEGGNFVQVGSASGASFAASVSAKIPGAGHYLAMIPSAQAIYLLADTASVNVAWTIFQK